MTPSGTPLPMRRLYPALLGAALAFSTLGLAACGEAPAARDTVRPVRVQLVEPIPAQRTETYAGQIVARQETPTAFRVGGRMVARLVDVGDEVAQGQVLARLDAQDYRLALRAAEAELARATANAQQAGAELERYRPLLERGVVSRAQFDRVLAAADAARAGLDQARARMDLARNDVSYTELVADAAGVVTGLTAEVGQVVAAGQTVLTLAATLEREVQINVPEARIAALAEGSTAEVRLWADSSPVVAATVREIAPAADPVTRTYRVRLSLPEATAAVRLGMTATVSFAAPGAQMVVRLPPTAIFQQGEQPAVWVLDEGGHRVRLRPVEIAAFHTGAVAIRSGLAEGERVVIAGVHRLDESLPVRVWDGGLP